MTYWPAIEASMGVITPSGNTVVERVTLMIMRHFPRISCHFSRTPVFGGSDPYPESYDWDGMLGAAELLGHAGVDLLVWNGSKAGGIRFDLDDELAARVDRPLVSSTLALRRRAKQQDWRRVGLVTPYVKAYGRQVERVFAAEGLACVAARHAGSSDNLGHASIDASTIKAMCHEAASAKPDVLITWCTNFPAAPLVDEIEQATGLPMLDSTSLAVHEGLLRLGVDTRPADSWGSIFRSASPSDAIEARTSGTIEASTSDEIEECPASENVDDRRKT